MSLHMAGSLYLRGIMIAVMPELIVDVELLSFPPTSGQYREYRFDAYGSCTWVKFGVDGLDDWVGVFGNGYLGKSAVAQLDDHSATFVLAGGRGYLVDHEKRELVYKTQVDYYQDVLAIPQLPFVVACDYTKLEAFGRCGSVWKGARVSYDGIRLEKATRQQIDGCVWNTMDWIPFVLKTNNWEYVCEWQFPKELD